MCSDMCPCDDTSFEKGGYDEFSEEELALFNRSSFLRFSGNIENNMMTTRTDLD